MRKKEMREVEVIYCDVCGKEIKDLHYTTFVEEFCGKEKHFHDMFERNCYKKYKESKR